LPSLVSLHALLQEEQFQGTLLVACEPNYTKSKPWLFQAINQYNAQWNVEWALTAAKALLNWVVIWRIRR
jgi:hypothetical protein